MNTANKIKYTTIFIVQIIFGFEASAFSIDVEKFLLNPENKSFVEKLTLEDIDPNSYMSNGLHILYEKFHERNFEHFVILLKGGSDPSLRCKEKSEITIIQKILLTPVNEKYLEAVLLFGFDPNTKIKDRFRDGVNYHLIEYTLVTNKISYTSLLRKYGADISDDEGYILNLLKETLNRKSYRSFIYLCGVKKVFENINMSGKVKKMIQSHFEQEDNDYSSYWARKVKKLEKKD